MALLLDGDSSALDDLREQIARLSVQKKELLVSNGFPEDYLEPHYFCPDCRDTGYIGTDKCHCFKKAIVDLLYMQSNLQFFLDADIISDQVQYRIAAADPGEDPCRVDFFNVLQRKIGGNDC